MPDDEFPAKPTSTELSDVGVKLNEVSNPDRRDHDPLERYRSVPNHSMFLFTSEDTLIHRYVKDHWAALDGMSGDVCDIHVPLMQLRGEADAYSQLDELRGVMGLGALRPSDLPALHIWSSEASVRIPLGPYRTEDSLRDVLRLVFTRIADLARPLLRSDAIDLVRLVEGADNVPGVSGQLVAHASVGGSIIQITHNHHYGTEKTMSEANGNKSQQKASDVELTGDITQRSDASDTTQSIERAKAHNLSQATSSKKDRLSVGPYSAYGKWAVVGLALVVIAVVLLNILLG